jgi:hypothetical protein
VEEEENDEDAEIARLRGEEEEIERAREKQKAREEAGTKKKAAPPKRGEFFHVHLCPVR